MQYRQNSNKHQGLSCLSHRGLHEAGVAIDSISSKAVQLIIQVVVHSGFMMLDVRHGCAVMLALGGGAFATRRVLGRVAQVRMI